LSVITRTATVVAQILIDRPTDHVAHGVKIKMQIERDAVVESEAVIVNGVAANEAKTEGDNLARFSPDEKTRVFRQHLGDAAKKFLAQRFEFHWRALVHLETERIDRVNR